MKMVTINSSMNGMHRTQSLSRMRAGLRLGTFVLTVILIMTMNSLPVLADTELFEEAGNYYCGDTRNVAASDFNGDGYTDLAVPTLGTLDGKVTILMNKGDGTLEEAGTYCEPQSSLGIAVGDFNGDGCPDLAVPDAASNCISVLLGNGDGTFQAAPDCSVGLGPSSIAVADFNDDGDQDLVTVNMGSANTSILLGNGDGTFQPAVSQSIGASSPAMFSVAVGDFDADSHPDMAVTNPTDNVVSVLLGNGDGTFQSAVNYSAGNGPYSVSVGDIDSDGDSDMVVGNAISGDVSVLLSEGNGTFQDAVNYSVLGAPSSSVMDDIDNDGHIDLMVANGAGQNISVLLGKGDGTFRSAGNCSTGMMPSCIIAADLNGDGRPDLVTANAFTKGISILLNNIKLEELGLPATMSDLTAGGNIYDLNNLQITGLNQVGTPIEVDGLTITWDCSGATGSILNGHYLVPIYPGHGGTVTATINGITSNSCSFEVLPAVNNADLSALTVTPGSISDFSKDKVTYAVHGSEDTASLTVTATTNDDRSELTISGQTAFSGVPLTVQLDNGANLIPIVVTAADAQTQKAYVLSVNGTVSDADLDSLSVSTGEIDFSPLKEDYSQTVDADTDSFTVSARSNDPKALVLLNGSPMENGVPKNVNLAYGANRIDVMVVAQDATTKTYTIDVTRGQPTITWESGSLEATDISTTGLTLTWPAAYCAAGISGYNVYQGECLLSTVMDSVHNYNVVGLAQGTSYDFSVKAVDQAGNLSNPLKLSVSTDSRLKITTDTLPVATVNQAYSTTLAAIGGKSPYTWSATGLPQGLFLDSDTGSITGISSVAGTSVVNVTLTDSLGMTSSKGYTISIFYPAGGGQYTVTPSSDTAYTAGTTPEGINTMTVNNGVSGFKYFTVDIETVQSHKGDEVAVFVQIRNGVQIAINATKADFDGENRAMAAFNVKPGDIIKVYIVDDLTNDTNSNPTLLQ